MAFENQNARRVCYKNDRNILTTKKKHFPRERFENFFEFCFRNRHTLYARDVQRKGRNISKPHGWTRIIHILHVYIMGRMIPCVITRCRIGKTGWSVGGCIPRRVRAYSTVPITYTYDSDDFCVRSAVPNLHIQNTYKRNTYGLLLFVTISSVFFKSQTLLRIIYLDVRNV